MRSIEGREESERELESEKHRRERKEWEKEEDRTRFKSLIRSHCSTKLQLLSRLLSPSFGFREKRE